MSLIDDLQIGTCLITFGREADLLGTQAALTLTVTPRASGISGPLDLRWIATGDIFSSYTLRTAADPGLQGSLRLPWTDQNGFAVGSRAFTGWYYTAEIARSITNSNGSQSLTVRTYRFQIPTGTTSLDLDSMDEDGTVTVVPSLAPIPTVTSVVGLTGAVTVAQIIAALNAAGFTGGSSGGSSGTTNDFTDNGDGTYSPNTFTVTDNGDGTYTSNGTAVDNGDGTYTLDDV